MLKRKDLAKRWGVTIRTVHNWMRTKGIPYHMQMNGRYWFDEKEIEEWEKKMGLFGKKD